jgi:UDP-N-acetylglucosamine--N-acetylmuramyl-(pentapeptide) pyrophosphoryl-undecaprenol N-acetylglucosamine transferase
VIFSKGGFVSLPVVVAGWLRGVPVFMHESDMTPGLANRLCFPFVKKVFVTFRGTAKYFKDENKVILSGTPVREELLLGYAKVGREICGFTEDKRVILVYGGSLGSDTINDAVRKLLPQLLPQFQIAHVCGKGKIAKGYENYSGYKQFEYLNQEFPHVMAESDLVISRAGANSVYELMVLRKPHILIPLGRKSSRGDQIENAKYFTGVGLSEVIFEDELTPQSLLEKINFVNKNTDFIREKLKQFKVFESADIIFDEINKNLV